MRVEGEYGSHRFIFEHCLLAVGAQRRALATVPLDGVTVLSPEQALALTKVPAALSIVGNDYIALELATLFARLGTNITLLLPGDALLDDVDPSALRLVQAGLRSLGVQIVANTHPVDRSDDTVVYTVGDKAEKQTAPLPLVVSLGVQPQPAESLRLREGGVRYGQDGALVLDNSGRTSNERVYAAGDCRGGQALASVAIKQAKVAAEALTGARVQYAPLVTPLVALTAPEFANAGLSPQAAQAAGYRTITGRFPLAANGRVLTLGANAGLALVTADADSGALLGVTLVAPRAADLISQAALAIEMGATLTDLTEILFAHPSLSETLLEGAEAALGRAIHILSAAPANAGV
jgi:dihydrolipoamide dehydrogenase